MKNGIVIVILALLALAADGQEYNKCVKRFFKNGRVSTTECFDSDNRFGKACAYNSAGKLIYEKSLRKIAGHASVAFQYYNSGAVKRAEWHDAPDAGIQWYNTTTLFAEDGAIISETHNDYDNTPGTTIRLLRHTKEEAPTDTPHTAACAVIYTSELWIVNKTPYAVAVDARRGDEWRTVRLKPKEEQQCASMIQAQYFDDPTKYYKVTISPVQAKRKTQFILLPSGKAAEQVSKEVRKYYYEIRRVI